MKLSSLRFHLTRQTSNVKVAGRNPDPSDAVATTISGAQTCYQCPFKGNGCYAENFPLSLHFDRVTRGERGVGWREHLADLATLPQGGKLRINVAGDLPHTLGRLSRRYLVALFAVIKSRGLKAWTYTHHDPANGDNAALIRRAQKSGLTINVSTETEAAADRAVAAGLPAVLACPSDETRSQWRTPAGNVVLICPAQRRDDAACSTCMLCHQGGRGRRVIVGFVSHGASKRKSDAAIAAQREVSHA